MVFLESNEFYLQNDVKLLKRILCQLNKQNKLIFANFELKTFRFICPDRRMEFRVGSGLNFRAADWMIQSLI